MKKLLLIIIAFMINTGNLFPQSWDQLIKTVSSDRAANDNFGYSVSISGDYAIVGAFIEDEDASGGNTKSEAGSAYIFHRSGETWTQQQKIVASDRAAGDYFGWSVSISGDYAIVGAYLEDEDASSGSTLAGAGSAYIFHRSGETWTQQQKIAASDRAANDYFGRSVSISGDYAIVGAFFDDDASGANTLSNAGSAYIFTRSGETWTQQQKIAASDRAADDYFGYSVSISGDYAIVGAYCDDDASGANPLSNAGSAYIFTRSGETWTQQQKIAASDRADGDYFGNSVSISGDYVIVGADGDNFGTGSAYIFYRSGETWTQQQKIVASDRELGDSFGFSVSISGDYAIVGARYGEEVFDNEYYDEGFAYIFHRSGVTWTQQKKIVASDRAAGDYFGISVSISGGYAIVGANHENEDASGGSSKSDAGSAYIFNCIYYVNLNSSSGSNNGTSWANAYTSLQSALDAATSFGEIWVAKGTYYPSSAYDLTNTSRYYHFRMKDGVAIYGGFAGTETAISQRTNFAAGGTNETTLSGDIGTADVNTDNCYHVFYHPDSYGLTSSAILNGFTIKRSYAENNSGASHLYRGGGMHNGTGNNPTIEYCTFNSNTAGLGGGIYNITCSPSISNCVFSNNTALNLGGGIYLTTSSNAVITNCLIINNNAVATGGGIYLYASAIGNACNPVITNTTIANNSADLCGGIRIKFSTPTLNNCIIWGNSDINAQNAGIQIFMDGAGSTTTLNYSCYSNGANDVFGIPTASSCITTDPQFAGSGDYPFSIIGESPCADEGDDSYNSTSYDIRGAGFSRKLNKLDGTAGTIDMGAYEYKFGNDALPVELISFAANVTDGKVTLNWQTATEVNNYGFEIERSFVIGQQALDNWENIGFVQGSGNSNSPKEYSFTDENPPAGNLKYRLKQIDTDGQFEYYGTIAEVNLSTTVVHEKELPEEFALLQNYPNPFNPSTTIQYSLPFNSIVKIEIYNSLGEKISTLIDEEDDPGVKQIVWNADNLPSGIYFIRMNAQAIEGEGNFNFVRRMILIK